MRPVGIEMHVGEQGEKDKAPGAQNEQRERRVVSTLN